MRVIALAASKGGVGKSTLTAALAVRAAEESPRVALVDLDPQLSLASWWDRRGKPANPQLYEDIDSNIEAIEMIASEGWEYLFLDTPPSQIDRIEPAIFCSDFVVIPTRAGIMDVEAIRVTEELCLLHKKPYAFAINMAVPSAATASVAAQLRTNRRLLLEPYVTFRQSHSNAMFAGRSAGETRDGTAKREIDELWRSLQDAMTKKRAAA